MESMFQLMKAALLTCLLSLLLVGSSSANPSVDTVPISITGELIVLYMDDFKNKRAELQYFIEDRQSKKQYRLQFNGTPPGLLRSGATVNIHGKAKGDQIFLDANGVDSGADTVALATMAVTGEQNTLVMAANFTDADISCPIADIHDLMFTDATHQSINDLYQQTSHGSIWLTGLVTGPYNINYSQNTCDYIAWGKAVDEAARASGLEPDSYEHKVYVFPSNACPAAGIGTVGGNPSRAWVFHCDVADIFGHEYGHNLGMHHAATPSYEYGDYSDIMGLAMNRLRQINAPHKEQLGWLPDIQVETVGQPGYYDIAPLEHNAADALAPQALKLAKPDTNEFYYISYRRGIGFDTNLGASYLDRISVHRYPGDGSASLTHLLALPADGESFTDPVNGITVTQLSHNDDYATVEVAFDGLEPAPTCTPGTPQVSLSPSSQSATAGTTLNYSVSVANTDDTNCGASTFALTDSIPSGWTATFLPTTLSLAPGETASASLTVTSSATASASTYSINVSVNDDSEATHTASGSASYTVVQACAVSTPGLSLSPGSQSVDAGATAIYTISLTNNDDPACSDSAFSLEPILPGWNGSISPGTITLSPGEQGMASLIVTSPDTATPGSYTLQVRASDSLNPARDTSATATYVVNEITPAEDTEAPTAPTGVSASANFKQVSLSWSPSSDNVAVLGYGILRDGVLIADVTDTSYADTGGTDGVIYTYTVLAYDAAANLSPESDPVMAGKTKTKAKGKGSDGGTTDSGSGNQGKGKGSLK